MISKTIISLFLVLFVSFVYSNKAELLFQKKIVDFPVVGKELLISFNIYNVGKENAHDVSFVDTDFTSDGAFEIVTGSSSGKWETIAPNSHVSQNLTVIPKTQGMYPLTSTQLKYRSSQSDREFTYSSAASYSVMYVESLNDYEMRTSHHVKEWIIFVVLCLLSVAFPFSIYSYYRKNYENGIKKAN